MQFSKAFRKLKGFTLIESMLGLMVIGLVSGSIMLGITTVEKKLFKIRLKEHAFEILRNYTNFLGSRIVAGNMPDNIVDSGKDVVIYKHEDKNNIVTDVYTAKIYFEKDRHCSLDCKDEDGICSDICNGKMYSLETTIIWPNESDFQDTLKLFTYQIELTK